MLGNLKETMRKGTLKYFSPTKGQVYYSPAMRDETVLQQYIIDNYSLVKGIFKEQGLDFVYPPLQILGGFSEPTITRLVRFYLPWQKPGNQNSFRNTLLLRCSYLLEKGKPQIPSVANEEGRRFPLYSQDSSSYEEQFRRIAKAFSTPVGTYDEKREKPKPIIPPVPTIQKTPTEKCCDEDSGIRFSVSSTPRFSITESVGAQNDSTGSQGAARVSRLSRVSDDGARERRRQEPRIAVPEAFSGGDELERLFRQLRSIMPEHSIRELLSNALRTNEVVSRIVITEQFRIILPDYDNMEIKMTPKEKAMYLLFLRHPEGIQLKLLPDHKRELGRIYRKVAKRDAKQVIEDIIEKMALSITGDADTQRSRIKGKINTAFKEKFCIDCAHWYTINGTKGEKMRIELPQDKIIWKVDI